MRIVRAHFDKKPFPFAAEKFPDQVFLDDLLQNRRFDVKYHNDNSLPTGFGSPVSSNTA